MAQIYDVALGGFRPLSTTDLAGMGGGAGSGADRELVVTTYRVKTAFSGASVGDTITATQVIDVSAAPTTVSTIWRNQTTAADLGGAPLAANLEIVGAQALTDAQLRASMVGVEPLGAAGVARQLSATNASQNTALTATCRRISIRARTSDVRYVIGTGAQTANATTSHYIAADERLDLAVPANAQIAVILDTAASANGVLEVTELA